MSDHSSALDTGFPADYSAFQAARTRFLDRLHVDSMLWQAARDARLAEGGGEMASRAVLDRRETRRETEARRGDGRVAP